jgi:hypothetical protein
MARVAGALSIQGAVVTGAGRTPVLFLLGVVGQSLPLRLKLCGTPQWSPLSWPAVGMVARHGLNQ